MLENTGFVNGGVPAAAPLRTTYNAGVTAQGKAEANMETFHCPYLGGAVELSDNRERHITDKHADLLPDHLEYISGTLASPDLILRKRPIDNDIQFYRWYYGNWNKYLVVAVVNDPGRNWIVTAFPSDRVPRGELLWQRS